MTLNVQSEHADGIADVECRQLPSMHCTPGAPVTMTTVTVYHNYHENNDISHNNENTTNTMTQTDTWSY